VSFLICVVFGSRSLKYGALKLNASYPTCGDGTPRYLQDNAESFPNGIELGLLE